MARVRALNPGFFLDDELADLSPLHRILFAGLWCVADREGRLKDNPRRIKAEVLPYDDCDLSTMLDDLSTGGFIHRYVVDGQSYIAIASWLKYQNPHHKEPISSIPSCMDQAWLKHESSMAQACFKHARSSSSSSSSSMDASPNKDLCPKCLKTHIEKPLEPDGHCALCGYRKRAKP